MKSPLPLLLPAILWSVAIPTLLLPRPANHLLLAILCLPVILAAATALTAWLARRLSAAGLPADEARVQAESVLAPAWLAAPAPLALLTHRPGIAFLALGLSVALVSHDLALLITRTSRTAPGILARRILLAAFLLGFVLLFRANIVHDAFQYYGYLVSLCLDGDLDLYNQIYLANAHRFHNPFPLHSARYAGTWLLETPFFLIGQLVTLLLNRWGGIHPVNGYSVPYLAAVSTASSLAGLAALVLTYRLLRTFHSRRISLLAVLATCFASPWAFFMYCWNGWPHPFATALVAAFLLTWQRTRGNRRPVHWAALGTIGGWLALVQPVAGLILICPLVEFLASSITPAPHRGRRLALAFGGLAICGLTALTLFSPQFSIWKVLSGAWRAAPYSEIGDFHDWLHPHFAGLLFSVTQNGLLAWSPIVIPALIGLLFLLKTDRRLGWAALLTTGLTFYVYAAWSIWWSGVGFSNRFFVHLSPLFALGLAALLARTERRVSRQTVVAALAAFVLWNFSLMGAYLRQALPMGIPDPSRVLANPLTFRTLLDIQLRETQANLAGILGSHWINENFILSRIRHALLFRDWLEIAGAALVLAAVAAAAWLLIRLLASQPRILLPATLAGSALTVLATHLILFRAAAHTPIPYPCHRFDEINVELTRPAEDSHIYSSYREPVSTVDLLTFLTYSHSVTQGCPVAQIDIVGSDGQILPYTIRAGLDSAETSYPRPEYVQSIRHSLNPDRIARSRPTTLYSRHRYELLTFHTAIHLPYPMVVARLDFRYLADNGRLVVSEIFMR